ncbi:MAG TPA: SLC13 family permease [Planctomycetaceae bacterium]|nr:SLC13 family permease [Planctomycetaceae bacterium]
MTMGWEAWLVLAVVALLVGSLARELAGADVLCIGALAIFVLAAEMTGTKLLPDAAEAVKGFGNPGLVSVGILFVVVAGLVQTGAMNLITEPVLGRPKTVFSAQLRLLLPVTISSAFLNNTPIVAMFMPVCGDISKKSNISPSKLFMPMAFAATFGGVCTMIGTSTNLVVGDLVRTQTDYPALGMWDISWIGIPCSVAGCLYMLAFSRWLLPDRRPAISLSDDPRQYTVEMEVEAAGPLVNRTVEEAGLRHLPGLFLAEIERDGNIVPAVGPHERLQANDRLVFVGIIESVVDLRKMRGLRPATNQVFKLGAPDTQRSLIEAVVSPRCPVVGKTIRDGRFRTKYNAAVIAVARSGERIQGKIGDIVLQPGDTLLVEAHSDFARLQRNSNDFFLVSNVENSAPPRHGKAWLALGLLAAMVAANTFLGLDILVTALVAGLLMIVTRCVTAGEARQSIDWSVLVTIGAALGIGKALQSSGLAEFVADQLVSWAGPNPWVQLAVIYFLAMLLTELVTNNAAAVLMFPIAMETVKTLDVNHLPFVMAIMVAASMGFATPFGYQTNLMVYGPGGYKFVDYLRVGIPLDLLMMAVTVLLSPFIWPFYPG